MTGQDPQSVDHAKAVRHRHEKELMAKANVVGVGVGLIRHQGNLSGGVGIVVMVRQKVPRDRLNAEDVIPTEIEGVPVEVQEVGEVRAL